MKHTIFFILTCFCSFAFTQTLPYRKGNAWGLVDKNMKLKSDFSYEDAIPWDNESGCLKKNEKWAIYHKNHLSEPIFEAAFPMQETDNFYLFKENGKYGLLNDSLAVLVPAKYDSIGLFANWEYYESEELGGGRMLLSDSPYAVVINEDKYGLIDKNGIAVIPCIYQHITPITRNSLYDSSIEDYKVSYFYRVQKANAHALFQNPSKQISPFVYDKIVPFNNYSAFFEIQKGKYLGAMNREGKEILPCQYNMIRLWDMDVFYAKKAGLCAVLNSEGKEILPFQFDEIEMLNNDTSYFFRTRKGKNLATWSKEGKPINWTVPPKRKMEKNYRSFEILEKEGKWGVRDTIEDVTIIPYLYDKIVGLGDGFWVKKNGKWNRFDTEGKKLTYLDYDRVIDISDNGHCMVAKEGKKGLYNSFLDIEIIPCQYEELIYLAYWQGHLLYWYQKDSSYGFINYNEGEGLDISPALFEEYEFFESNYSADNYLPLIKVKVKGEWKLWNLAKQYYFYNSIATIEHIISHDKNFDAILKENEEFFVVKTEYKTSDICYISPIWKDYKYHYDKSFWITDGKNWQIFDNDSLKIQTEYGEYDEVKEVENYFIVRKEGKYGLLSSKLESILPCKYELLILKGGGIYPFQEIETEYGKAYIYEVERLWDESSQYK